MSKLPFEVMEHGVLDYWVVDQRGDAEMGNWLYAKFRWREHADEYCAFKNAQLNLPPEPTVAQLALRELFKRRKKW